MVSTSASIGKAGTAFRLLPSDHDAAFVGARHDAQHLPLRRAFGAERGQRRVEVGCLVEALHLALIGEQNVERAGANQPQELVAEAVDAEAVRQGQRDLTAGGVRHRARGSERLLGVPSSQR